MPTPQKIYFLVIAFTAGLLNGYAQKGYSSNDSLQVIQRIGQVSQLTQAAKIPEAMAAARETLNFCEQKNFLYGRTLTAIKINEILIAAGDYTGQAAPAGMITQWGQQLGNDELTGIGCLQQAQYKMYNNKAREAEPLFVKAIGLLKNGSSYTALAWNERGFNAGLLSDLQKQTDYFLTALRLYEKLNDQPGMAMVYSNLSVLYNDINQPETGIAYAKKSIVIRETLNDLNGLSYVYCNISQMYLTIDLKEAGRYSQLCSKTAAAINNDGRRIHAINTAGLVKERMGQKGETLKSSLEVLAILEKKSNPSVDLARQYLATGIIMSEGRMDSATALQYLDKGLNMSLLLSDKPSIRDAYISKTVFFKIRNDFYNAYEHIKKYHSYKDSIITGATQTNIAELQTRYETEKKDNEILRLYNSQKINQLQIEQLNTEQRIRQLTIEKQNALLAGNRLLAKQKEDEIVLLSKERQLLDLQVKRQAETLEKQTLLAKTREQQLQLSEKERALNGAAVKRQKQNNRIIAGAALAALLLGLVLFNRYQLKKKLAEQEALLAVRDTIAKDLHDEVGSALSSIKILSEVSLKNMDKDRSKAAALLEQIVVQSERSQQGISDIVWSVKPDNDRLENMTVRMREYLSHTLEARNIRFLFQANEEALDKKLNMQQRKDVLLIFKEAVNNIVKHSGARGVRILIEIQDNNLLFHFIDNGCGFNPHTITSSSGLKNMKARAASLNGRMHIVSAPGQGAHLTLTIPIC